MVTNLSITHGNPTLSEVALTFDDGPSAYTPQVLAILQHYNVQATFFCRGKNSWQFPSHLQQALAGGNAVGNHTLTHPHLPTLPFPEIYEELSNTQNIIQQTTGACPTIFRPPYGEYNSDVLRAASQLGLTIVTWSASANDWTDPQPPVSQIVSNMLGGARNGAILLFHEGGGNRANTVEALPAIIDGLQTRGLRLVTLSQMLSTLHT